MVSAPLNSLMCLHLCSEGFTDPRPTLVNIPLAVPAYSLTTSCVDRGSPEEGLPLLSPRASHQPALDHQAWTRCYCVFYTDATSVTAPTDAPAGRAVARSLPAATCWWMIVISWSRCSAVFHLNATKTRLLRYSNKTISVFSALL